MRESISLNPGPAYGHESEPLDTRSCIDVLDAAYHTAHRYPGGVPALAARMCTNPNTLMKKVGVNVDTHHLNLKEAVAMQELSGDVSILQAMAEALGYTCVRSIPAGTDDPVALHWQMVAQLADMQHAMADAFAGGVSQNSLRRCNVMSAEAISAINNVIGALRAKLPTPPGGAL